MIHAEWTCTSIHELMSASDEIAMVCRSLISRVRVRVRMNVQDRVCAMQNSQ